jgi:hypothetical protein
MKSNEFQQIRDQLATANRHNEIHKANDAKLNFELQDAQK